MHIRRGRRLYSRYSFSKKNIFRLETNFTADFVDDRKGPRSIRQTLLPSLPLSFFVFIDGLHVSIRRALELLFLPTNWIDVVR